MKRQQQQQQQGRYNRRCCITVQRQQQQQQRQQRQQQLLLSLLVLLVTVICLISTTTLFNTSNVLLFATAAAPTTTTTTPRTKLDQIKNFGRTIRKYVNFGSLFSTSTKINNNNNYEAPYDRIIGNPVFAVTTAWGSPYLNMEKLTDLEEVIEGNSGSGSGSSSGSTGGKAQSLSEEQNEYRMVGLYFTDPDDAIATLGEMKQIDNMVNSDIRITTMSLGKAIRHASNLGSGLLTGAPIDSKTGSLNPPDDGSMLRYKIVPSTRQLYYAARCIGKERVGLGFSSDSSSSSSSSSGSTEEAQLTVLGRTAIDAYNLQRRRDKRERKTPKRQSNMNQLQLLNQHMDGYSGIPIFYCTNMYKRLPLIKRILTGVEYEIPMFFNYEDLLDTYNTITTTTTNSINEQQQQQQQQLPSVEVFNLWDVLTSIDRYQHIQKKQKLEERRQFFATTFLGRNNKKNTDTTTASTKKTGTNTNNVMVDLNSITFIPNSRCVRYKDSISTRGNGKARLRPMRNYQ